MTKTRRFGTEKTTTKQGKRAYMQPYMVDYRKQERDLINRAKKQFGWCKNK